MNRWVVAGIGAVAETGMIAFFWAWRPPLWHVAMFCAFWFIANAARKSQTLRHAGLNGGRDRG